jgi:hypothetical protein
MNRHVLYLFIATVIPFESPVITSDFISVKIFFNAELVPTSKNLTSGIIVLPIALLIFMIIVSIIFLTTYQRETFLQRKDYAA